ncbi:type II toxin-antitoxin system VapC family toxin [Desulfurococcus amylolyticus]|uniref:PilT protein domain protein n=1 Tax=Desulfurococcus amylolyticus DSM 16532 TaxID=768672 RepID=I3XQD9_DESAM|nr:type II toxin-antitoxin system VapC family toxin [Desulfurococcus amylolyticus]AFL66163.1 PilT protein domain protein [Desulfurococcus amylolyticus DSM 16532]
MKVFIDSPLLIYLNTMADHKARIIYENFYIDMLTRYKPYTDVLVLDELIYISKKKYGIPYNITIEFIESNVLPYISITSLGEEEYKQAIKFLSNYNLKPSDSLHLGAMINNGINTIVSEDREFDKIPIVRRLWI